MNSSTVLSFLNSTGMSNNTASSTGVESDAGGNLNSLPLYIMLGICLAPCAFYATFLCLGVTMSTLSGLARSARNCFNSTSECFKSAMSYYNQGMFKANNEALIPPQTGVELVDVTVASPAKV